MDDYAFTCPHCQTELAIPENEWYYTCTGCRKRLNLESQYAFLRGLDAFSEGQDVMEKVSPRQRRNPLNPRDREAMDLFLEAYTSLQIAFKADLADDQRSLGVEMMASMATEFMKRSMVSILEMNYWTILLVIQNSQTEYSQLKEKLATANGPFAFLWRLRWRGRQNRLRKSLVDLHRKLMVIEKQIDFIEIPKARNKSWAP